MMYGRYIPISPVTTYKRSDAVNLSGFLAHLNQL